MGQGSGRDWLSFADFFKNFLEQLDRLDPGMQQ